MSEQEKIEEKEQEKIRKELFKLNEKDYNGNYCDDVLVQYKMYVDIMDKTSTRRQNANNFFLALNSFLITIMGIFLNRSDYPLFISLSWAVVTAVFGIMLCIVWRDIIIEYKNLNTGRGVIILLLEERLPAKVFKAEWDYLHPDGTPRYAKLSVTEMNVPIIFVILYILLAVLGTLLLFSPSAYSTIVEYFNATIV